MIKLFRTLKNDNRGAVMVEFALVLTLTLLLTGGVIEGLFVLFQFNQAVKAAERGARIAVVSGPVPQGLISLDTTGGTAGQPYPAGGYSSVCSTTSTTYASLAVTCTSLTNDAVNNATVNATNRNAAFAKIVFGRPPPSAPGTYACGDAIGTYYVGMCDIFGRLEPRNVQISYTATGLGYYGAPEGPAPTVAVTISGVPYSFFFLSALAGIVGGTMPPITATASAEDLKSTYP